MKEFWIYTGMRLGLFAGSVALVGGIWLAVAASANVMWVLIIALRQRTALAQHVDDRARRVTARIEEMNAKEDVE